jgi:hypothetical protein
MTMAGTSVEQVPDRHRYEITLDGERVGFVTYRDSADVRTFPHAEIDPAHEGQGLAGQLVGFALDDARASHLRVVPECPYVAAFIGKHPEYAHLVVDA